MREEAKKQRELKERTVPEGGAGWPWSLLAVQAVPRGTWLSCNEWLERDLHICQSLFFLPVPHRQHVVVGVVHSTEMTSSVLPRKSRHRKTTCEN